MPIRVKVIKKQGHHYIVSPPNSTDTLTFQLFSAQYVFVIIKVPLFSIYKQYINFY